MTMMDCETARQLTSAHLDNELTVSESLEMERHLRICPECRAQLQGLQALSEAMKKHAIYFAPRAGLEERISAAVAQETLSTRNPNTRSGWWKWSGWQLGLSFAFIVLIFSNLFLYRAIPNSEERVANDAIASHVRSLMTAHSIDVVSSDQHTVKPWFNGKVDFSPPVNDFSAQGFPLIGGRVDYVAGRPVAVAVYRRRQHPIDLYVWPAGGSPDNSVKNLSQQGYNIVHWTRGGMIFWAVSDVANTDLKEFARFVMNASDPGMKTP